jgi:hypothetical protein
VPSPTAPRRVRNEGIERDLELARKAWARVMSRHNNHLGVARLPVYPMLGDEHVRNCQVLSSRERIIQKMKKGGHVAEIGVQEGVFSRFILEDNHPAKLHLFDIDLRRFDIAGRFARQIEAGQVVLHEGDSSVEVAKLPDRYFDFIYVDGDHSYEGVRRDIAASRSKIKDDGYLVFNDYTFWSPAECMMYGVVQAVNELCLAEGWELRYFALACYMYCDVALQRSQT